MNSNKYKILVVEDEEILQNHLTNILEADGYQVLIAETCDLALMMFASHFPDIVILNLGLPDKDGMLFLEEIRSDSAVPVIVLSARSGEKDKVNALDAGANDYVTKPFGSAELLARIRCALRNVHSTDNGKLPGGKLMFENIIIDYDLRRLYVNGREIKLTQTEYNIVAWLSEHRGKVMTYSAIIKAIWGFSDSGSNKKLQVNMANIRKKMGIKPSDDCFIVNEPGIGYLMK